jgi:cytochrome c peroxidase
MNNKERIEIGIGIAILLLSVNGALALEPQEQLGKNIFYDTDLSTPPGQACADCHGPNVGFTGPDSYTNAHGAVYEGAINGRYGNRKPPSAAYAGNSPPLHVEGTTFVGGMFWDGRATGNVLGDPLTEQAQGPFLNPLEQNNPTAKLVVDKILRSSYSTLFKDVCGDSYDVNNYYICAASSIAAFERSNEVSKYASRYDDWLMNGIGLTPEEENGRILFEGKANCSNCHPSPEFTDFTYDNLGVPRNPENPFYGMPPKWNPDGNNFIDYGLGGYLKNAGYDQSVYESELGKMKVPTLRNVNKRQNEDFVKAYSHNGYFKSLESIVHFYNTRDKLPTCGDGNEGVDCWPAPEVNQNINTLELGDLGLSPSEESDIVAFLKTLDDQ